ncbi:uncharacterized protein LOC121977985 [Zingiber officinale]|uniref:Uncharacterized protein n=1 Tax=Zingiber officinale TaxID=94328 RepID=A0A8J5GRM2_ZINOF|nr:uncharacterized protein LOC121977985 [Zingiber officinale]KAG6512585.1 hypothetical protein ZIOFF_030710 [Zingiber officinale]
MASVNVFFGRRARSASYRSGGGSGPGDLQRSGPNCGLGRLVRKLRRQSKMLSVAMTKSTAFGCQYDPLSYSRNFDRNGFGAALDDDDDDEDGSSDHFYYTFSSRFVAGTSSSCSCRVPCNCGINVAADAAAAASL